VHSRIAATVLLTTVVLACGSATAVLAAEPAKAKKPEPVTCRDMLHRNSNVIERVCMTKTDWIRYRRASTRESERLVRMMQGSAYEGGAVN
jgi:hypothetical protein